MSWRGLVRHVLGWMDKRLIWGLAVAMLLLGVAGLPAAALGEGPPWRRSLRCEQDLQIYQGVQYCTQVGGPAHVLVVDLYEQSGLGFEYIIAKGNNRDGIFRECLDVNLKENSDGPGCNDPADGLYPIMPLMDAVRRLPNTAAVVNTDYGAKSGGDRGHGPEGLTIVRGSRLDGPNPRDIDNNAVKRPWLALSESSPFQVELGQLTADNGDKPYPWIYTGVGGAPWLVQDGQKQQFHINNCTNAKPHSCQSPEAQAAMGLSQSRRWLYFVVANDMDANAIADFMVEDLQVWEAIKLDGGGSTQMWYGGLPGTKPEDKQIYSDRGRWLSQYLAIIARPGSGITLESPRLRASLLDTVTPIVLDEGQTTTLDPTFSNDGEITWRAAEDVKLARKAASPFGEETYFPLPHDVAPGQTVRWDLPADASSVHIYRFQMTQDELTFGDEAEFMVIVLPEALVDQRDELERLIEDAQAQGEQELEVLSQRIQEWLLTEGTEIAEGLFQVILRELEEVAVKLAEAALESAVSYCNSIAILPIASLVVLVWARDRRK